MKKENLISVITPTHNRSHYHKRLYECFKKQTYKKKELLILDDSPAPSPFFTKLKDPRVHYEHIDKKLTIGEKRNYLLDKAKGEVIAHFDDDDFYAPRYLSTMARNLGDEYSLVKLAGWFTYNEEQNSFFYWDTTNLSSHHFIVQANRPLETVKGIEEFDHSFIASTLWGYGFSYVYRRSIYPDISFEKEDNFQEDIHFVQKIQKAGLACRCILDTEGLAAHVIHRSHVSRTFPQFQLPHFVIEGSFAELVKIQEE